MPFPKCALIACFLQHKKMCDYGEAFHVFERPIEQTIKVAECPAAGMSILDYAPKNPAAESYRSLAREVLSLG